MLTWFKNPAASAKAVVAFLLMVQPFLTTIGVDLSGIAAFLNEAWLTGLLTVLAPIVVWLTPNAKAAEAEDAKPTARPGGSSTMAPIVKSIALALALSVPLAACALDRPPDPQVQAVTPRQAVGSVEAAFTGVVLGLSAARDAGLIERGSDLEAEITAGILATDAALDSAQAAVRQNSPAWQQWLGVAEAGIAALRTRLAATKE